MAQDKPSSLLVSEQYMNIDERTSDTSQVVAGYLSAEYCI